MKKGFIRLFLAGAISLGVTIPVLAEDDTNSKFMKLELMIQSKVFESPSGISSMQSTADSLNYEYKAILYNKYSKNGGLGCGLNLLLVSLGSWVIGDTTSAIIHDLICLAALGLIGNKDSAPLGLILGLGNLVASAFTAINYADGYNSKLKRSLNLSLAYDNYDKSMYSNEIFRQNKSDDTIGLNFLSFGF